jgi:hypothetical protein
MVELEQYLGENLRRANAAITTIDDVLDCTPAVNSLYRNSGLTLRDILATTAASRAFHDAFERSDFFLVYCGESPPGAVPRRQWVLVHLRVATEVRRAWLESWDETRFPQVCQRRSQFFLSVEWVNSRRSKKIPPEVAVPAVIAGAAVGGAAGALGGSLVPLIGTGCGAAVGAVGGAAAAYFTVSGLASDFLAVLDAELYSKFKKRVARVELEATINTFIEMSDPVAACYHCNIGHRAINTCYATDQPVQFIENQTGHIFDRTALTDAVHALTTDDQTALITFKPNPHRGSTRAHVGQNRQTTTALTSETSAAVFATLNSMLEYVDPVPPDASPSKSPIRLADLSQDVRGTMSLDEVRNLTVISSFRTAFAMLCRKVYLIRTALRDDCVPSPDLRAVRDSLQIELDCKAHEVGSLAKEQIDAFARIIWSAIPRQEDENKGYLHAELARAAVGDHAVAFTPLLALARQQSGWWAPKLARAWVLLREEASRDPIATFYACVVNEAVIDAGRCVAEDRDGHLLDVCYWQERLGPLYLELATYSSNGKKLAFKLADLDFDINEADFPLERLREMTLIYSHRTTYAILCRQLRMLDDGKLVDQMKRENIEVMRSGLRKELVEQITISRALAIEQILRVVELLRRTTSWAERNRLERKLEDELNQAAGGKAQVQFTPLLALEQKLIEMRQEDDDRG